MLLTSVIDLLEAGSSTGAADYFRQVSAPVLFRLMWLFAEVQPGRRLRSVAIPVPDTRLVVRSERVVVSLRDQPASVITRRCGGLISDSFSIFFLSLHLSGIDWRSSADRQSKAIHPFVFPLELY